MRFFYTYHQNTLGFEFYILFRYFAEGIVTIGCSMDFAKYPFDSHRCKFLLGSTGYSDDFMKFNSTFSYPALEDIGMKQRPLQYLVNYLILTYLQYRKVQEKILQ